MFEIANCCHDMQWHLSSVTTGKSHIPAEALIAPARNLLTPEAFAQRHHLFPVTGKIQQLIYENGLFFPEALSAPIPINNHCLPMSLHFIKRFHQTKNIPAAAKLMQDGAPLECGQTTSIYNHLFYANVSAAATQQMPIKNFIAGMRETIANTLDLTFTKEITLRYPLTALMPYFQNELPAGEYAIPLIDHVVTLIKQENGALTLFDPNQGTINLSTEKGCQVCLDLFKKHRVHLTETLSLLKITDSQTAASTPREKIEIIFPEEKPKLSFERGKDRWGTAVFTWRGKTTRLPWDTKTGYIYNSDSPNLIRAKCALLISRTWIDTTFRVIYHLGMTILRTLTFPFACVAGKQKMAEQIRKIKESAADIFRAPFYAVSKTYAAIYGLFKPLDGRRLYGYFERSLNRQNHQVNPRLKHYIAPCFKPWNFAIQHDENATIEHLKKVMLQLESFKGSPIFEIFCGWRRTLPCCS